MNEKAGEKAMEAELYLPPGFRFHPTDEEVVTAYLTRKALNIAFCCPVMADVDLNKIEPWDLPSKAKMGEKEWYFFCHKDRKYPTGTRTNRATESGYWKATGKDKEIFRGRGVLVGMKKTLVFYRGRAPRGEKTPWVMHEFRLDGRLPADLPRSAKDDWAVCRVFNKDLAAKNGAPQMAPPAAAAANALGMERTDSFAFLSDFLNDCNAELPALVDPAASSDVDDQVNDSFNNNMSGASTSTSTAPNDDMESYYQYQAVKTEQHHHMATAPPPHQQSPSYFSFPAAAAPANNATGGGYSQYQAMGGDQPIRRYCKPMAPPTSAPRGDNTGGDLSLDDLFFTDSLPEYCSNMWKL